MSCQRFSDYTLTGPSCFSPEDFPLCPDSLRTTTLLPGTLPVAGLRRSVRPRELNQSQGHRNGECFSLEEHAGQSTHSRRCRRHGTLLVPCAFWHARDHDQRQSRPRCELLRGPPAPAMEVRRRPRSRRHPTQPRRRPTRRPHRVTSNMGRTPPAGRRIARARRFHPSSTPSHAVPLGTPPGQRAIHNRSARQPRRARRARLRRHQKATAHTQRSTHEPRHG